MLPDFNTCEKIIQHRKTFVKKEDEVSGYKITQYTYRIATYTDFTRPLTSNNVTAFELRGICFVHRNKKNLIDTNRYIMLNKFFNLNQTSGWMYEDLKDKEIDYVQEKLDGSLIRFIKLPDGKVIAKTIFDLSSVQAIEANKIYKSNEKLRRFVNFTLDRGIAAMFEFTSPYNRIVVKYNDESLRLLAMRREKSGEYFSKEQLEYYSKTFDIPSANFCDNLSLDEYVEKAKKETGNEGWVITFKDSQKVKIKTLWYLSLHRVLTSVVQRENEIILSILEGSSDDLIAYLPEDDEYNRNKIEDLTFKLTNYLYNTCDEIYEIIENNFDGDKKSFAIKFKDHEFFKIMMYNLDLNYENISRLVIEFIKKKTKNLYEAKKFIETKL